MPEDTTPSAALFPTTGRYTSTTISASVPGVKERANFSKLVQFNAPRRKVELTALYGSNYISTTSRDVISGTWEEIESGYYQGSNGKQIYRINAINQAQQVLKYNWTKQDWSPNSTLAKAFQKMPNASVVKISATDQRIFFFNESNRVVGCYPAAK